MVFATAKNESTVFLLFSEEDINDMRSGRTKFIDSRHTGGLKFDKIIVSLHKTNEEALKLLNCIKDKDTIYKETQPIGEEVKCNSCGSITELCYLLEGVCIVCWREKVRR